jgi:hypothetical protein
MGAADGMGASSTSWAKPGEERKMERQRKPARDLFIG